MSFKSKKKGQRAASRKIAKQDAGQRREISRLTRLVSDGNVYIGGAEADLKQTQWAANLLATVLDTRAHRALSWLRRMVRSRSEIPADLLDSMKVRNSSSVPPQ